MCGSFRPGLQISYTDAEKPRSREAEKLPRSRLAAEKLHIRMPRSPSEKLYIRMPRMPRSSINVREAIERDRGLFLLYPAYNLAQPCQGSAKPCPGT